MIHQKINSTITPFYLSFEMNKKVCDQLTVNDLLALSSVSKLFKQYFEQNFFWSNRVYIYPMQITCRQWISLSGLCDSVNKEINELTTGYTLKTHNILIKIASVCAECAGIAYSFKELKELLPYRNYEF